MNVELRWVPDYQEWRRAQNIVLGQDSRRSRNFYLNYFLPILAASAAWVFVVVFIASPNKSGATAFGWAVGLTVYAIWIWIARERAYKKIYKDGWPEGVERACYLVLSDENIHSATSGIGSADFEWSAVYKAVFDRELLVLFFTPTRFISIPVSAVPANMSKQVRELIESKVKQVIHAD